MGRFAFSSAHDRGGFLAAARQERQRAGNCHDRLPSEREGGVGPHRKYDSTNGSYGSRELRIADHAPASRQPERSIAHEQFRRRSDHLCACRQRDRILQLGIINIRLRFQQCKLNIRCRGYGVSIRDESLWRFLAREFGDVQRFRSLKYASPIGIHGFRRTRHSG